MCFRSKCQNSQSWKYLRYCMAQSYMINLASCQKSWEILRNIGVWFGNLMDYLDANGGKEKKCPSSEIARKMYPHSQSGATRKKMKSVLQKRLEKKHKHKKGQIFGFWWSKWFNSCIFAGLKSEMWFDWSCGWSLLGINHIESVIVGINTSITRSYKCRGLLSVLRLISFFLRIFEFFKFCEFIMDLDFKICS